VPKADNLPPPCAVVTKSGNFNFLRTLWACFTYYLFYAFVSLSHPALYLVVLPLDGHGVMTFLPSYCFLFYLLIYSLIFYFTFVPSSFSHFVHASVFLYLHLLRLVELS